MTPFPRLASALLALALALHSAPACQICIPIPTVSAAGHLIAADTVALARENPDKPFSLAATEVLKGSLDSPEIDLFLDSHSRRVLSNDPTRQVICVRSVQDGSLQWRRIGITSPEIDKVVRHILTNTQTWQSEPSSRLTFFAPYLRSRDRFLNSLAHLEIGSAPYADIRSLGQVLPLEEIRNFLADFRMIEWHALYILLLAGSDDPQDHERIAAAVRSAARFSTGTQLAAWTTAYIETDPANAFDFVRSEYLTDMARPEDEIRHVLTALSVHGNTPGTPHRDRIVAAYRTLLAHHPDLAPAVVPDLTSWKRWDFVSQISEILASRPTDITPENLQMRTYVRLGSESAAHAPRPEKNTPISLILLLAVLVAVPPLALFLRSKKSPLSQE